jgi:hypothetical protein
MAASPPVVNEWNSDGEREDKQKWRCEQKTRSEAVLASND